MINQSHKPEERIRPMTVELAYAFDKMRSSYGERPLNRRRVEKYKALIRAGKFLNFRFAEGYRYDQGPEDKCRFNGQHTARAAVEVYEETPDLFPYDRDAVITTHRYNRGDEPEIHRTYDTRDSVRTSTEQLSGDLRGMEELDALILDPDTCELRSKDLALCKYVLAAIHLALKDEGMAIKGSIDGRALYFKKIPEAVDFAYWINSLKESSNSRHGWIFKGNRGVGVMSVMFDDFRRGKDLANEVWLDVLSGNNVNHTSQQMNDELLRVSGKGNCGQVAARKAIKKLWNNYSKVPRGRRSQSGFMNGNGARIGY